MPTIIDIINEEIMNTVANYPLFGDHLRSISEVGEGTTTAYPFKFENTSFDEVHYYFNTEKYEYDVQINQTDPHANIWDMQFGAVGGSVKDITNEGKPFQIMSTLIQITNDFIEKFKPNVLRFKPEKDEERPDDNRRFNFYMAFIKKNMRPEYFVFKYGDYIVIERKTKIKSNILKI
jgi:hypothetical protein